MCLHDLRAKNVGVSYVLYVPYVTKFRRVRHTLRTIRGKCSDAPYVPYLPYVQKLFEFPACVTCPTCQIFWYSLRGLCALCAKNLGLLYLSICLKFWLAPRAKILSVKKSKRNIAFRGLLLLPPHPSIYPPSSYHPSRNNIKVFLSHSATTFAYLYVVPNFTINV